MELFTVFLSSLFTWGAGKVFDAVVGCPRCAVRRSLQLVNASVNRLECPRCAASIRQFTNACSLTVNLNTGQVGHAVLGFYSRAWE